MKPILGTVASASPRAHELREGRGACRWGPGPGRVRMALLRASMCPQGERHVRFPSLPWGSVSPEARPEERGPQQAILESSPGCEATRPAWPEARVGRALAGNGPRASAGARLCAPGNRTGQQGRRLARSVVRESGSQNLPPSQCGAAGWERGVGRPLPGSPAWW